MTPKLPDTFRGALDGIRDREFCTTRKYRDQQWKADRKGADEEILVFERLLVRRMKNLGVPMYANEVMRSAERQRLLHSAGRSKLTSGPHMVGGAVDVIHSLKGWELGNDDAATRRAWLIVGHVGKEIIAQEGLKLRWGGDWKFYDPAHWERIDWKDLPPF